MTSLTPERAGWFAPLARPVRIKNGPTLRTLGDLRAFILDEPATVHERKIWQCACELLLAAAEGSGDIGEVTEKVELALFLESRWLPARPIVLVHPSRDDATVSDIQVAAREKGTLPAIRVPEPVHEMMRLVRALTFMKRNKDRAA